MNPAQNSSQMGIGTLAARTGCSVPTICYYEEIGLIPPAQRRESGHRYYDQAAEDVLTFVRRCRDFGFSIEQVRELLALSTNEERDCVEMRDIAQASLNSVRAKLIELRALKRSLTDFVRSCTAACAGGPATQCNIVQNLGAGKATVPGNACCG